MKPTAVPKPIASPIIALTPEQTRQLRDVSRAERDAELEVKRVQALALAEHLAAVQAKNRLWEALADEYGFDPNDTLEFDVKAGTLTPKVQR